MAYLLGNTTPCSAFGETREEALENLSICLDELTSEIYDLCEYE